MFNLQEVGAGSLRPAAREFQGWSNRAAAAWRNVAGVDFFPLGSTQGCSLLAIWGFEAQLLREIGAGSKAKAKKAPAILPGPLLIECLFAD
jgi:hypothetical protein